MASSKVLASTALFLSFNILFAAVFVNSDKYPFGNGNGNGDHNDNGNANSNGDNSSNGILGFLPCNGIANGNGNSINNNNGIGNGNSNNNGIGNGNSNNNNNNNNGIGNGNSNNNGIGNGNGNGILGLLPGLNSINLGGNSAGGGSSGNSQNSNLPAVGGRKSGNHQGQGQGNSGCGTLNLGVCLNLLNLVNLDVGDVPTEPCCSLIQGLADLEVAACLCTDIKADVLGILNINLPVSLSLLLNNCGRKVPSNYICNP